MGDSVLEVVLKHTYLGVELDSKLSWANHIQSVTSRANRMLGLLRRNLFSCSPKVKAVSYKILVRPRLEYCASVWDPYQKEYIKQLEGVQRRAARFVLNRHERRSSVSEMISYLKWQPLEHRRAAQRLTFLYKSIHNLIAVDTDHYQNRSSGVGVSTRIRSSVSFKKLSAVKDCYKHSLYPRTFPNGTFSLPMLEIPPPLEPLKIPYKSSTWAK